MAAARNYSSVARLAALTAGVNSSATTLAVDQTTGFPTVPFTMILDAGLTGEEAVTITGVVGLNLTAVRGEDGTAAQPHNAGASVRHMATARDYREAAEHIAATSNVHGTTGTLVTTSDAQVLDNKTFTAGVTDHVPLKVMAAASQSADLMQATSSAGTVLASITPTGRVATPGVDGSSSSTFTTNSPVIVPLIVKAGAAQTAKALSVRDAASIELASIGPDGTLASHSATVSGDVTVSGEIFTGNFKSTGTAEMTTASTGVVPAIVRVPTGGTATPLVVRNPADGDMAGILSETGGYQMFHGGSAANIVPFKVVGGSLLVTIGAGATSQGSTIDYSAFGFTQTPLVIVTVRQDNESVLKRRVTANVENIPGLTTCGVRVIQTSNEVLPDAANYRVYWIAYQFHPNQAVS